MKLFFLLLKWLLILLLTAVVLLWWVMHSSHVRTNSMEWQFAGIVLFLCVLLWIVIRKKSTY